mgnify:CR=1 FL=1
MTELIFKSTIYNIPYYYDPVSNKTSWYPMDDNRKAFKKLIQEANNFKPPDLSKNPMDINPNYAVKSKKYGYNYFFNIETKRSKWEIPRTPVDRIMTVGIEFVINTSWEQIDSNYDIIMEWLNINLSSIRYNNYVDLPLHIEWVKKSKHSWSNSSNSTIRVRTNVYDALTPFELEDFYDLLKNPDDDGNYPIYYHLATKILSLEQPEGKENKDWISSLVYLQYDD